LSALMKAVPVKDLDTPVLDGLEKLLIEGRVLEFAVWAFELAGNAEVPSVKVFAPT